MTVENPISSPFELPSSKGVIFVVDDESAFCDVVCEILEAIGYDPHYALNAAEALQMLPQVNPDLILSDVMMPEMDGLSFVRHLRDHEAWKAIPVIIVSAKATPDDRLNALDSGASDFLAKPFSSYDLEELIERNLKRDGY